jgi:hypothetical protein
LYPAISISFLSTDSSPAAQVIVKFMISSLSKNQVQITDLRPDFYEKSLLDFFYGMGILIFQKKYIKQTRK